MMQYFKMSSFGGGKVQHGDLKNNTISKKAVFHWLYLADNLLWLCVVCVGTKNDTKFPRAHCLRPVAVPLTV